jgi:hypothetical protein
MVAGLVSLSSFAAITPHTVPTGKYHFRNSTLTYAKDNKVVFISTKKGQEERERLKKDGYTCQTISSRFSKCSKFFDVNHDDLSGLNIHEETSYYITPTFGEEYELEITADGDSVTTYKVKQTVSSERGTTDHYFMYVTDRDDVFVDITFGGSTYRFKVVNRYDLTALLTHSKTFGRFHFMNYGTTGLYEK